jgi:hypothetical protein
MYKYIIQGIDGAENFGLISLVIFSVFFSVLLIWVFTVDKSYINHMKDLPMDNSEETENFNPNKHE